VKQINIWKSFFIFHAFITGWLLYAFERYVVVGCNRFQLRSQFFFVDTQPLVSHGLLITESSRSYSDTPHSLGLLRTSDKPEAETSTWLHIILTRDIYPCPGGFRSHNSSKQAAADPQLRPRGYTVHQTVTNKYKLGPLHFITQGANNPCSKLLQTLKLTWWRPTFVLLQ